MNQPKILILDIETAPNKVYSWGLYEQNIGINQIIREGYVLCWCAKWVGQNRIMSDALINYPSYYKKNPTSDLKIAQSVWKLLDEADIVVTHNGDQFDISWLNTIFIKNKLKPVSPFKSVDTLKEIRSSFRFVSNKLGYVCKSLNLDTKLEHEGFDLWIKCMAGNKTAWSNMLRYCRQDVKILEDLYHQIKPYMKRHPNLNLYYDNGKVVCPNCGSPDYKKKGFAYTSMSKFQRFECTKCGKNFRSRKPLNNKASKSVTSIN